MTPIELQIFNKLKRLKRSNALKGATEGNLTEGQAKAVAEIAMKWIRNAFDDGYYASAGEPFTEEEINSDDLPAVICWKRWLKENGL
jgi:hypothetical protein